MLATHETNDHHFIILPDGRLERADGRIPADVEIHEIVLPVVSNDLVVQARYENMRIAGESHNMAEMLATRSFPGAKTDSIFNEGKFSGQSNSGCQAKETWLRRDAEKNGFSTNGMWYCSGLAEYPGDPRAWVGSRGDVEKQARERNLTVDGYVNHKGYAIEPKADIPIAHDIVEAETRDIMDAMPGSKYEDVYERVSDVRTGKVDLNPLRVSEPNMSLDWA